MVARYGLRSYCSNYYSEYAEPIEICDWCQCEERNPSSSSSRNGIPSSSSARNNKHAIANEVRSAYSGEKIKQHHRDDAADKPAGKTPSPRTRRYKLLKDVMC